MKKGIYFGMSPDESGYRASLELLKDAGFDGIELPAWESLDQMADAAQIAGEVGLGISSVMAGTHWQLPLSSTDEHVRVKGVEGIEHSLRCAVAAGTDSVLVVPGLVDADTSYAAAYELSHKSLREILPTAEELGVTMLIENVWNKFLLSPLEMRCYIDSFESPLVAAYFDVGNILLYGFPHQWIEILGDRVKRVHVKDFSVATRQFVGLLQGDVDYPRAMNALRGIGYDSYITAELSAYKQYTERFYRDTGAQLEAIIGS